MSVTYTVRIFQRIGAANYYDFAHGSSVAELTFGYTKYGGCAAFSATLVLDDWSGAEAFMLCENFVEIYVDVGSGSQILSYTGTIQKLDAADNTPPGHKARKISGYGIIAEVKSILVLDVYESMTIQNIAKDLITSHLKTPLTGVANYTTAVTTGTDYTIAQTVFMDTPGDEAVRKLADVYSAGGTVVDWGVDQQRRLYFRPQSATTVLTLTLGEEASGVTLLRHEYGPVGPNALIIEGRECRQGNPMSIYETDIISGERTRMKKLRAPSLIDGADMLSYAQWLLARDKDAAEAIQVEVCGIEDMLASVILQARGIVAVSGVGSWQIQAVTYAVSGGRLNATFELGDRYLPDPSEHLRDLLRDTAVLDASEFSNVRELLAKDEDFADRAYLHMVGTHGMRNVVVYDMSKVKPLDQSDADDEPVIDLNWLRDHPTWSYAPAVLDTSAGAFTGKRGNIYTEDFWTFPIAMGRTYQRFSLLAKVGYPILIAQNPSGDLASLFTEYRTSDALVKWDTTDEGIYPRLWSTALPNVTHDSDLITTRAMAASLKIVVDCTWGQHPVLAIANHRRYIYDTYCDTSYYSRIELYRYDASDLGVKYVRHSPYQADDTAFDVHIPASDGDKLRFTFDHTDIDYDDPDFPTYSFGTRTVKIENLTTASSQTQTVVDWFQLYFVDASAVRWSPRVGIGIHQIKTFSAAEWHHIDWTTTSITFSDCALSTTGAWMVARVPTPDSADFEEGFNALTGTVVNLGASPGAADGNIIVRCRVTSPLMIQAFAIAWDTPG